MKKGLIYNQAINMAEFLMGNIQFRAWHILSRKMYDVIRANVLRNRIMLLDGEGKIVESPFHEVDLMQFTGHYDRNGAPIFEKDIVENYLFVDVVVYKNGILTMERSKENIISDEAVPIHGELEVIGNVYQNSSLINDSSHNSVLQVACN